MADRTEQVIDSKDSKPEGQPETDSGAVHAILDKDTNKALMEVNAAAALQTTVAHLHDLQITNGDPKAPKDPTVKIAQKDGTTTVTQSEHFIAGHHGRHATTGTVETELTEKNGKETVDQTTTNPEDHSKQWKNHAHIDESGDTSFADQNVVHTNPDKKSGYVQIPMADGTDLSLRHYWKPGADGKPAEQSIVAVNRDGKEVAKVQPNEDGSRTLIYPDQHRETHYPTTDGSPAVVVTQKTQADGTHEFFQMGNDQRHEWNFERVQNKDGTTDYYVNTKEFPELSKPGQEDERIKLAQLPDSPELKKARDDLKTLEESKISDPNERAKFDADMLRLETRLNKNVDEITDPKAKADALAKAQSEAEGTYKQVARLLRGDYTFYSAVDSSHLKQLAEEVMSQAGTPSSIRQDRDQTCQTVQTMEMRTYTKHPELAAKTVADVALNGSYTSPDGQTTVTFLSGDLNPKGAANMQHLSDGQRSFASQLYQDTAVNMDYKFNQGGQYVYRENDDGSGQTLKDDQDFIYPTNIKVSDTYSERFQQTATVFGEMHQPNYVGNDLQRTYEKMTGEKLNPGDFAVCEDDIKGKDGKVDPEKLKSKLTELKAEGKLPIAVSIYIDNEPIRSDNVNNQNGAPGPSPGEGHWISVTDYNPETGKCNIDNSWLRGGDRTGPRALSVEEVASVMQSPQANLDSLKNDARANPDSPSFHPRYALEKLRLESQLGLKPDADAKTQKAEADRIATEYCRIVQAAEKQNYDFKSASSEIARLVLNDAFQDAGPAAQAEIKTRMQQIDPGGKWLSNFTDGNLDRLKGL